MKRIFICLGKVLFCLLDWFNRIVVKIVKSINTGYYIHGMAIVGSNPSILYPTDRIKGRKYIHLGNEVTVGRRAVLTVWNEVSDAPSLKIGNGVSIGDDCHITVADNVIIGEGTLFGKKVTISDNSHGNISFRSMQIPPLERGIGVKGGITIGRNVWVGDKVTILGNVTIGEGSIIGANSVVTKDVPAYSIAAGVPAKILKQFKE